MTEKLYYTAPDLYEFEARIVAVETGTSGVRVALDRTCFYPEGGGQPADRGTIGGVAVTEVQKRDGVIWHSLERRPESGVVIGRVDRERRFEYMQQHTGQHIVSAAFHRLYAHPTVSVHQGGEVTTVELGIETLSERELEAVQIEANRAVRDDLPVSTTEVPEQDLARFPLRREAKVAGVVRVVEIGEFDCAACGGLHLQRTGLVQLVNCVGVERIRGRVRTAWKIGDRALADYRQRTAVVNDLGTLFSAQLHDLREKARKTVESAAELQKHQGATERRLAGEIAGRLRRDAEPAGGAPLVITAEFSRDNPKLLRAVIDTLIAEPRTAVCIANRTGEALHWWVGASADLTFDFTEHVERLLAPIAGKGGGRRPVWQGAGEQVEGIPRFFEVFAELVQ